MLDHAREAVALAAGRSRADLDRERLLLLGLVKLIEIIGEAASRVSTETQAAHPHTPWPQIVAMRNRLVHGYDKVDYDRVWKVVTEEMPPLIDQLSRLLP